MSTSSGTAAVGKKLVPSVVNNVLTDKACVVFLSLACHSSWAFLMIFQGVMFSRLDHRWKQSQGAGGDGMRATDEFVWQHSVSLLGITALFFRLFHNVFFSRFTSRQRVVLCYATLGLGLTPFLVFLFFVHFATSNQPYISRSPYWLLVSALSCGVAMGTMDPNLQRSLPPNLKPYFFYGKAMGYNLQSIIGFSLLSVGVSLVFLLATLVLFNCCAIFIFTRVLTAERLYQSDQNYRLKNGSGKAPMKYTLSINTNCDERRLVEPISDCIDADELRKDSEAGNEMVYANSFCPAQTEESDKCPLTSNETKRLLSGDFGAEMDEWLEFKRALEEWRQWLPECIPHFAAFMVAISCTCLFGTVQFYLYNGSKVPLWRSAWNGGGDGVVWIPMPTFFVVCSFMNMLFQSVGPKYVYSANLETPRHFLAHYCVLLLCLAVFCPVAAGMFGAVRVPLLLMCGMAGMDLVASSVAALSTRYFDTYVSARFRLACFSLWYMCADVGLFIGLNSFAFVAAYVCHGAPDEHQWYCKD